jgi:hypothetical protein
MLQGLRIVAHLSPAQLERENCGSVSVFSSARAHSPFLGLLNIVPQVLVIIALSRLDRLAAGCLVPLFGLHLQLF